MSVLLLCNSLKRLAVTSGSATSTRNISACSSPLFFKLTLSLYGEPLKKKKRLDPAIVRAREERKKKKLEKQIKRLEKNSRQLKPIDEVEVPIILLNENRSRKASVLTPEILDERVLLTKAWSRYKLKSHLADVQMIDRIMYSQQKALDELQKESEDLYQAAIQVDPDFLPFIVKGPVENPPSKTYDPPDGEYIDISKKWE
uniref:Large ribosomal subunit protein mL40 n=1 Tax=Clastoptera arizonana TaxID=38151 RepID=A0A1B6DHD1_9HEMI